MNKDKENDDNNNLNSISLSIYFVKIIRTDIYKSDIFINADNKKNIEINY